MIHVFLFQDSRIHFPQTSRHLLIHGLGWWPQWLLYMFKLARGTVVWARKDSVSLESQDLSLSSSSKTWVSFFLFLIARRYTCLIKRERESTPPHTPWGMITPPFFLLQFLHPLGIGGMYTHTPGVFLWLQGPRPKPHSQPSCGLWLPQLPRSLASVFICATLRKWLRSLGLSVFICERISVLPTSQKVCLFFLASVRMINFNS